MPQQGDVHVLPGGDGWKVKVEGGGAESSYATQDEAIRIARDIARRNDAELLVHDREGHVRERDTHGSDPRSVPG